MQSGYRVEKEPITIDGLQKLKDELIFLKEKKRPEIVSAIAEARSHGDLKENAEYHAAKEQQSHNEGRIQEVEDTLADSGTVNQRAKAKMQGFEGDSCNECGNFTLVRNGTCLKCNTCGSTSGCS